MSNFRIALDIAREIRNRAVALDALATLEPMLCEAGDTLGGNEVLYRSLRTARDTAVAALWDAENAIGILSPGVPADDVSTMLPYSLDTVDGIMRRCEDRVRVA